MGESTAGKLARAGFGLSSLATLAWLLWPSTNWSLDPEPAVAFGTATTLWLVAEGRSLFRRQPHPHDVEFIRELRDAISLDTLRYLKQHDFGSTYDNERLDAFWKIDHDAEAPGYGPQDPVLQRKFGVFREKLREFSLLLAANGGPIGANVRLATIIPDQERASDQFSDQTWELVRQANALADEVVSLHQELMQAALRRVPGAFALAEPRAERA